MRTKLAVFLLVGVGLVFSLLVGRRMYESRGLPRGAFEVKTLRLLTYATFVGSSGPGPEVIRSFEAANGCKVEVVTSGDAGLLLERLKVAEARSPFDVVVGLDQLLIPDAESRYKWKELFFGREGRDPVLAEYASPHFVPYDWSPLAFVYRKGDFPVPESIDDLVKPEFKAQFALQDPRSSSPGLQFLHWVQVLKENDAGDFLRRLKPNVNSVSPSWAFSYGLFKKNQTRFVWSYLTSLAFHWGVEDDRDYRVAVFKEGHPVQVEYMAIPDSCRECALAEKFVAHLLKPDMQKIVMEKNFMLPVIKGLEEGTVFGQLPALKIVRTATGKDLREWDKVFTR